MKELETVVQDEKNKWILITGILQVLACRSCSKERYLPVRRCFRRTASSIYPDTRADPVLLPVWIYS